MMPKWLRRKVRQWSDSYEVAEAARREKRWSERNIELSGQVHGLAEELKRERALHAETVTALIATRDELSDAQARIRRTRERYQKLREVDRELSAGRAGEIAALKAEIDRLKEQPSPSDCDYCEEVLRPRRELATVTAERDRARMVQTAQYDLHDTASEKRYMDMVGETP